MNPRVLLSAYQCAPGMGSVSQIGWEWYHRLAKQTTVTLVTHVRNRAVLEQHGVPLTGSEVVYIDSEWFAGPLYRFASACFPRSEHPVFLISSLDFFVYDWMAVRRLKRLQRRGRNWDIVHAVTPVSPWAATRLHRLKRPLIVGPWNGGLASPRGFPEIMRAESKWLYPLRSLGRFMQAATGCLRKTRLILTATDATKTVIAPRFHNKCRFMLENAVDTRLFTAAPYPPPANSERPLQIIFVGRLLPVKGIPMLLEAVAALTIPAHVTIIGDGSERATLERYIAKLKLSQQVTMLGNCPFNQIAQRLASAHVFCLPSVRESGGAVLLEAMAAARPVIALDYGGPAEIVDPQVGIKLPATNKKVVVSGLVSVLKNVAEHPDQWAVRGSNGRNRVEKQYGWNAKIDTALTWYKEIIEAQA